MSPKERREQAIEDNPLFFKVENEQVVVDILKDLKGMVRIDVYWIDRYVIHPSSDFGIMASVEVLGDIHDPVQDI